MKLSIIIPVYNEEKTVGKIIEKVKVVKLPQRVSREIIVVDDGSTDLTGKILKTIKGIELLKHQENKGKGAAVRTGLARASGDVLLIQDADLEYDPKDYVKLLEPIVTKKTQVVYGSRLMDYPLRLWGKDKTPLPFHYIGNKFLSFITRLLYGGRVTDMETCYKVFTKDIAKKLHLRSNSFDLEPEITAKILKQGYRIFEVPIKVKPRDYKEGKKITWRDGFFALWNLLRYRIVD
ncbi:glycosyl transferase [Candidatus Woesebacteria bacterium]|nr:glycosyl transferase [Candidatus Woesebacteria bacterium]